MKILVVGGGGREHALAWKLAQSARVSEIFLAPGNAGTHREARVENIPIAVDDMAGLVAFARDNTVDLTVVGPEVPLVAGIVDRFEAEGLKCFGPRKDAAQLEGSKAFCKAFLMRHGIPTAGYQAFTDMDEALAYLRVKGTPIVVKADGLAAGKGVVVARTELEAEMAVRDMLGENRFGAAGNRVVIEDFLEGEEASFIVMADGIHALPLASSQDHKARDDDDMGPNTGGMGAYSPAPVVTPAIHQRVMEEIILPTLRGMARDATPYTGFLYAGLMIDADGSPRVLEFNCRLGDPETQPLLMRLKTDLVELCLAALDTRLDQVQAEWDDRPALGVVMAAAGYPGTYATGQVIEGLPEGDNPDIKVFHAGTRDESGQIVTDGGRVLCVCARGDDYTDARNKAYAQVEKIGWESCHYRRDIGRRATGYNPQ
ncbi:phosphoribosylamine--glycine ligase [Candidatus Woesearchaeota archaeon]|nr:phosphoribosylamine--glycine ligase [Candidatus Woesearchaeota archaeon]